MFLPVSTTLRYVIYNWIYSFLLARPCKMPGWNNWYLRGNNPTQCKHCISLESPQAVPTSHTAPESLPMWLACFPSSSKCTNTCHFLVQETATQRTLLLLWLQLYLGGTFNIIVPKILHHNLSEFTTEGKESDFWWVGSLLFLVPRDL